MDPVERGVRIYASPHTTHACTDAQAIFRAIAQAREICCGQPAITGAIRARARRSDTAERPLRHAL